MGEAAKVSVRGEDEELRAELPDSRDGTGRRGEAPGDHRRHVPALVLPIGEG